MNKSVTCYLGLGSNLGDRSANLAEALRRLAEQPQIEVVRISSVYESDPVGPQGQPAFLNQVAQVQVTCPARALLAIIQRIESEMGRVRTQCWGPRTIDLDILLYGDETIDEPGLTVPHPQMLTRAFVLVPLAEIAPERVLADGRTAAQAAAVSAEEVRRVGI